MSLSAAALLQRAVYKALAEDETLSAHLTGVYDEAPVETPYPYLAMGQTSLTGSELKDSRGGTVEFDLDVYSDEPTQMQVKELAIIVETALDSADIELQDHSLVSLRLTRTAFTRLWDEAGSLYRARMGYSALIYQN